MGAVPPAIYLPSSDWRTYESPGEWQKDMTIDWDSEACMSFASNDTLETYINWLIATNQLNKPQLDFLTTNGYIVDGKVNFSDRFTAKMSGTTINGNDFEHVWGSIQDNGLVPESLWPFPMDELNASPANAWTIYYKEVPASVQAMGKEFLQYFSINWRWLVSDGNGASQGQFISWLSIAPIHIAIQVCDPWNTGAPINGCGPGAEHGVQLSKVDNGGDSHILDHYSPFDKLLSPNYILSYAVQGWINQTEVSVTATSTEQILTQEVGILGRIVALLESWLSTRKGTSLGVTGGIMSNMTIPSWLAGFIKNLAMVAIAAVVAYLSDPSHLTFLSASLALIVSGIFAAGESQLKTNSGGTTALFGAVRVR